MKLRSKTFLIIAAVFIGAFLVLAVLLRTFITNGYSREEVLNTREKVLQTQSLLDDTLTTMDNTLTDWAEWDETYRFVQDKNSDYLESNYVDSAFFNNRLNLAAVIDTKGNIIFAKAYDLVEGKPVPIPDGLGKYLISNSPLLSHTDTDNGVKGIISLSDYPMMVVSHPILTSQGSGPVRGTLIFGRNLDSVEIGRLSRITHLSLKAYQPDSVQMPADFKSILPALLQGTPVAVQPLDENTVAGYTLIKDISAQPALVLRIDSPRTLYAQSRNDIFYFTLALLAFGLLFIMVTLVILERLVISRISNLSFKVNTVGKKGNLSSRISLPGKDEVSSLATNINGMLENLEQSRKLQKESETFNSALLQDSPNPIEVLNPDGSIRFVNPALEKITEFSQAQLIGRKPPFPWWLNENAQQYGAELHESMSDKVQKHERHFHKQSGESFWVEITSSAIIENGKVEFLIANWVDITKRKQADSALRESEKRFRELAELLPELVFETDLHGKLIFVNRVAFSIFGYPTKDYVDLILVDLIAPEDGTVVKRNCQKILEGEDLGNFECTAIRKDGRRFPSFIHMASVRNNSGETTGLRGILVDITRQKEIEAELRSSEEYSTSLLNNSPNPIIVTNVDTSVRYVNPAFERLCGYSSAEVINMKAPYKWWRSENTDQYHQEITDGRTGQAGVIRGSERVYRNKQGNLFWISLTVNPIKQNEKILYYLGNWVDITERKKAEDALRESEEFSSSLRDNSPYPIMVINPDTSIRYVNPALEKISGYSALELVGHKAPYLFWPKAQVNLNMDKLPMVMQSNQKFESLFQKKTHESFWVDITSTPISERDKVKYILAIWVDITAQKLASEELEKLYQREKNLREALQVEIRSRTEFTRALVHELKTPLTPIMASSELLVEELTQEPLLGLARNVHRGAENMNRRVDELLDLARGEVGMLRVNLTPVEPELILHEVIKYMEPAAKSNGQSLSLDLPDQLPVIIADDDRIRQILLNLINNAIKYSSPGGKINVSAREIGNELVMEVRDTGRGISEDEQQKLFQPYYRIEGREHLSGLGLGLTLSKRLVELQNGRIWVKSQKGSGSTFAFSLPLKIDNHISNLA